MAAKKAFKTAPKAPGKKPESTPKARQFKISGGTKRPLKKVVGYKLSEKLHDRVALQAARLNSGSETKVWPAHVVEAALEAFLKLEKAEQQALLGKV